VPRARPERALRCASIAGRGACVQRASPGWPRPSPAVLLLEGGYKGVIATGWLAPFEQAWPLAACWADAPAPARPDLLLSLEAPRRRRGWDARGPGPITVASSFGGSACRPSRAPNTIENRPGPPGLVGSWLPAQSCLRPRVFRWSLADPRRPLAADQAAPRLELRPPPSTSACRRLVGGVRQPRNAPPWPRPRTRIARALGPGADPVGLEADCGGGTGRRLRRCWTITTVVTITKRLQQAMAWRVAGSDDALRT